MRGAVFVDTSAVLALLNPDDQSHGRARRVFEKLRAREAPLVTSSYVLVETYALLARRLGLGAVRAFRADLAPLISVFWVDEAAHEAALDLLLKGHAAGPSLVDMVSFVVMRSLRLDEAFAFDRHFKREGFVLLS